MKNYRMSRPSAIFSRHASRLTTTCVLAVGMMVGAARGGEQPPGSTPERLVQEAHQAAVSGDLAKHYGLLHEAIRIDPNFRLARWQLGQVQLDGQWIAVEEAQRRAAADPRQAEYRQQREVHGETPDGQLALARWCRKNGLDEESRFHWASVLAFQPANEEALRALGVRWHEGQLLTPAEIDAARKQDRARKQSARQWRATIARWYTAVASADSTLREAALEDVRSLAGADVIPALEEITFGRDAGRRDRAERFRQFSIAALDALDAMPAYAATESLVRHAVLSPMEEVREAAIERLKNRPPHDYVPLLLEGLAMPIESSFSVITDASGSVHYRHTLYREGPDRDWAVNVRRAALQHDLGGRRYVFDVATNTLEVGPPTGSEPAAMRKKAAVTSRYQNRFGSAATTTEWQVWQTNQVTEALNALIIHVLASTTGQNHGTPKAWWDWWWEKNEYDASGETPVYDEYYSDTDSFYYGGSSYAVRQPPGRRGSCFPKGTLVWTKTGERPIETLEMGDLVLSQNPDTGELAYKPVVGRTVRPPTDILKLKFEDGELHTTLGHPLWVAGIGWRMAKELDDGAMLHAITGTLPVVGVEALPEAEAFNLVVADFNTYFVGEQGILVHDNTPRKPTRATVPGLAAAN